jgi:DNA-binding NtrC family response regulator
MSAEIFVIGSGTSSMMYRAALVGYGYRVHEISTFEGARSLLRAGVVPHSIVIDVTAKAKETVRFISLICDELRLPIPIIVIGGSDREAQEARQHGATEFIQRPVQLADLVHTVQHCIQ